MAVRAPRRSPARASRRSTRSSGSLAAGRVAGTPVKRRVAAVSVGVIGTTPRLDLDYEEDVRAAVDMNVVMSSEGRFVEVQGTGEHGTFDRAELDALLDFAVKGLRELDAAQQSTLATPLG